MKNAFSQPPITVSVFDLLARPESDGTDLARHGDECSGAQTERGDGLQQTGHQRRRRPH